MSGGAQVVDTEKIVQGDFFQGFVSQHPLVTQPSLVHVTAGARVEILQYLSTWPQQDEGLATGICVTRVLKICTISRSC